LADSDKFDQFHERIVEKVFDSFLENKRELLKKIASKLAMNTHEEFDYDGDEYDAEQESAHLRIRKRSDISGGSRNSKGSRKGRRHKKKTKRNNDSDLDESKMSQQSHDPDRYDNDDDNENDDEDDDAYEDGDFTPNMMEKDSEDAFNEISSAGYINSNKVKRTPKPKHRVLYKNSESQHTLMMNIQTTADLISYVKRRHNKQIEPPMRGRKPSRGVIANTSSKSKLGKYSNMAGGAGVNHMRHFGVYSQTTMKSVEIQTEDLDILDLRVTEINLTEVYHFDKVSSCLKKIVIERGVDAEILRQFEYIHKDTLRPKYKTRHSIVGRFGKALSKQDQFRKNIADVVNKGEINRYNDALKAFMNKIKDYEHENAYLEEKRSCISSEFPLFKESENDVFNRGWRKGYSAGYTRGSSNGFFKGAIEAQYIGHQKGIEEGMQEGWNFGFDEGFKTGIRKVFRDAREAGIDLSNLELMEYISQEDRIKGLMKSLYSKLTKGKLIGFRWRF